MSSRLRLDATVLAAAVLFCPEAAAQADHGRLSGTVRTAGAQTVRGAIVSTTDGRVHARSDSLGQFVLEAVPAGRVQLRVRAIGYRTRDTALVIQGGGQTRWDAVLEPYAVAGEWADRESARAAAGTIDSVGRGLLRTAPPDAAAFSRFGREFFAQTLRRAAADANAVVSPASAAVALSMVLAGARGETAAEMARMLGPHGDDPVRRGAALVAALRDRKDITLHVANAVWVDNRLELQPGYQRTVTSSYGATVRAVSLATQRGADEINRWVSTETRGKIDGVLDEPLGGNAVLFIANAVYFKGKWIDEFDKRDTRQRDFTLASGRRVGVPAMERVGHFGYRRAHGYQLLRLPYRGGRTALYVALPDSGITVAALVDRLDAERWPASLGPAEASRVRVVLPRFKVERSMELNETLQAMGMRRAFDPAGADFGALARPRGGHGAAGLFVERALQKVFVEVNEEGTEAAAVTGIVMTLSAESGPRATFIVDRPFLFLLRDEVTGADLFIGRVADPR
jgi:serpin B